jgi:hypothetical protein
VGVKLIKRLIPHDVLTECRKLAETADVRRNEEIRSAGAVIGFVAVAILWLLVAAGSSALMVRYLRRS